MFGAERTFNLYIDKEEDDSNNTQELPSFIMPSFHVPHPWNRLRTTPGVLDMDFVLLAEFSELEGPRPVITIPSDGAQDFNMSDFTVRIMSLDHQTTTSHGFHLTEDSQVLMTEIRDNVFAFVHHVSLYDRHARGFVRPFAIAYVTPDHSKLMYFYEDLSLQMKKVARFLKYGNKLMFRNELETHLLDLQYTKAQMFLRHRSNSKSEAQSEDRMFQNLKSLEASITETQNILKVLKPTLNDKRMEQRFCRLEDKAKVDQRRPKADSFSLQEWDDVNILSMQVSGSLGDMPDVDNTLFPDNRFYTPKVVKISSDRKFDLHLRGLHELCSWGAKEGLQKLRHLYQFFRRDMSVLLSENFDRSLNEPSAGLLTFGEDVLASNFMAQIDKNCVSCCGGRQGYNIDNFLTKWPSADTLESFKSLDSSFKSAIDTESLPTTYSLPSSPERSDDAHQNVINESDTVKRNKRFPDSDFLEEIHIKRNSLRNSPCDNNCESISKQSQSSDMSLSDNDTKNSFSNSPCDNSDSLTKESGVSSCDIESTTTDNNLPLNHLPSINCENCTGCQARHLLDVDRENNLTGNKRSTDALGVTSSSHQCIVHKTKANLNDNYCSASDTGHDNKYGVQEVQNQVIDRGEDLSDHKINRRTDSQNRNQLMETNFGQDKVGIHSFINNTTDSTKKEQSIPRVNSNRIDIQNANLNSSFVEIQQTDSNGDHNVKGNSSKCLTEHSLLKTSATGRESYVKNVGKCELNIDLKNQRNDSLDGNDKREKGIDIPRDNSGKTNQTKDSSITDMNTDCYSQVTMETDKSKQVSVLSQSLKEVSLNEVTKPNSKAGISVGEDVGDTNLTSSGSRVELFATTHEEDVSAGFGLLKLFNTYPHLQHIIYSILTGRTVLIIGTVSMATDVKDVVSALSLFIPNSHRSSICCCKWTSRLPSIPDLSKVKITGVCRPEKRSVERWIPKALKRYVSILDIERKVIHSIPYQGYYLSLMASKKKVFHTEDAYLNLIKSLLVEIATKTFIYFHSVSMGSIGTHVNGYSVSGQSQFLRNTSSSFLNRIGIYDCDVHIVEHLAEVIKIQHIEEFFVSLGTNGTPSKPISVNHQQSVQIFK